MQPLSAGVQQVLHLLGQRFTAEGLRSYAVLEADLQRAQQEGDLTGEADAAIRLADQLKSVAKVSAAYADRPDRGGMPPQEEALAPAIDLYARALQIADDQGAEARAAYVGTQLGDCYAQSGQFSKAIALLEQTMRACQLPRDAVLGFTTAQLAGDCCLQMENDYDALSWYERGLSLARDIDDPFEVTVQLAKVASALRNLKRYGEAVAMYADARELLLRIGGDPDLQRRITIHKNLFTVAAIPRLVADTEARLAETRRAIGRDLLGDMPDMLAAVASAALIGRCVPKRDDWIVWRDLHGAVRAACCVLADLLQTPWNDTLETAVPEQTTLHKVGQLARQTVGEEVPDPRSLWHAARYLVQVDRWRRAANRVRRVEATTATPGPFGGATSGHVLYLRSFIASGHLPRRIVEPWGSIDLEELFACAMDRAGLFALGNPELERFGPGRAVTTDENWQAVLRSLATEAQLLLVVPAHTQGTAWEIEWAATNKFFHKTCFVMPPSAGADAEWWTANWRDLRKWAGGRGLNVPEYSMAGRLFRLTTEGLCDEIDFSHVYDTTDDLKMRLVYRLLSKLNVSMDFVYAMQQGLKPDSEQPASGSATAPEHAGLAARVDASSADLELLRTLELSDRREMSNWFYDAPQIPASPGVLMYFENPVRMLWAESAADLRDTLNRHAEGLPSPLRRFLFHERVLQILSKQQAEQLMAGEVTLEAIMSFRTKQLLSYRFVVLEDGPARERLVDLILRGVSTYGAPAFVVRSM